MLRQTKDRCIVDIVYWETAILGTLYFPKENESGVGALCVEMGFYANISWESRCNIKINVWAHFYKILLVFEVPYWPPSQKNAWKKIKQQKVGKGCLKLSSFFWFTHWWNHLCETDWFGVGKDINKILKFYRNELRL